MILRKFSCIFLLNAIYSTFLAHLRQTRKIFRGNRDRTPARNVAEGTRHFRALRTQAKTSFFETIDHFFWKFSAKTCRRYLSYQENPADGRFCPPPPLPAGHIKISSVGDSSRWVGVGERANPIDTAQGIAQARITQPTAPAQACSIHQAVSPPPGWLVHVRNQALLHSSVATSHLNNSKHKLPVAQAYINKKAYFCFRGI